MSQDLNTLSPDLKKLLIAFLTLRDILALVQVSKGSKAAYDNNEIWEVIMKRELAVMPKAIDTTKTYKDIYKENYLKDYLGQINFFIKWFIGRDNTEKYTSLDELSKLIISVFLAEIPSSKADKALDRLHVLINKANFINFCPDKIRDVKLIMERIEKEPLDFPGPQLKNLSQFRFQLYLRYMYSTISLNKSIFLSNSKSNVNERNKHSGVKACIFSGKNASYHIMSIHKLNNSTLIVQGTTQLAGGLGNTFAICFFETAKGEVLSDEMFATPFQRIHVSSTNNHFFVVQHTYKTITILENNKDFAKIREVFYEAEALKSSEKFIPGSLAITNLGSNYLIVCRSNTINVLDLETKVPALTLPCPDIIFKGVAVTKNFNIITVGIKSGKTPAICIQLWDLSQQKCINTLTLSNDFTIDHCLMKYTKNYQNKECIAICAENKMFIFSISQLSNKIELIKEFQFDEEICGIEFLNDDQIACCSRTDLFIGHETQILQEMKDGLAQNEGLRAQYGAVKQYHINSGKDDSENDPNYQGRGLKCNII